MLRILQVESENQYLRRLQFVMAGLTAHCFQCKDFARAEHWLKKRHFSLFIINCQVCKESSLSFLEQVRTEDPFLLILAYGKLSCTQQRLEFLKVVDELILEPFDIHEFRLRVLNLLKKRRLVVSEELPINPCLQYHSGSLLFCDSSQANYCIDLRHQEQLIFECLLDSANKIVPFDTLVRAVWGYGYTELSKKTLCVYIRRIRKKLGKQAKTLETVKGLGYRLKTSEGSSNKKYFPVFPDSKE